jgi:hypothetical protein
MSRVLILGIAIVVAACGSVVAATWRVEKDGSGDFTVIQDAVDAAADGDTIAIGPGRYDDFELNEFSAWIIAMVFDKSLSFIGSGIGSTVLGPASLEEGPDDSPVHGVYGIVVAAGDARTRIRGISFEHFKTRGIHFEGGRGEIEDCEFRHSGRGVLGVLPDGGWIRDCRFIENDVFQNASVSFHETVGMVVEDCVFERCPAGVSSFWPGCQDITVRNCTFVDGEFGVRFVDGASGAVEDCTLTGTMRVGISGSSAGTVRIERNTFDFTRSDSRCVMVWDSPGDYYLRENILQGRGTLVAMFDPDVGWDCRDNYFFRTADDAWYVRPSNPIYSGPVITLDFSGNYWGTTDVEEIAAWIYDNHDDPDHRYVVDFLPLADGPVSVQGRSLSAVKDLFRGEGAGAGGGE